jgi:hypothetical protein
MSFNELNSVELGLIFKSHAGSACSRGYAQKTK